MKTEQLTGRRGPVPTVAETPVVLDGSGEGLKAGDAQVVGGEIDAANGAVYPLNKVLVASAQAESAPGGAD